MANDEVLNDEVVEFSKDEKNFFKQYVAAYTNALMTNQMYNMSPTTINKALKDMNMNPALKDRDTVESMLASPKDYEKELRELSQHLMNVIMPIKRMKAYYAGILEFDYTLIPYVDSNTMKTTAFKKAETRVYDWIDDLNPKKAFKELVAGCLIEDGKYYYMRESESGIALQEMPSDYCKIVYRTETSYKYAFNMNYFLKGGVDLKGFAPEFTTYYNEMFLVPKNPNKYQANWVELDPDKAFVFKFDMLQAGLTPPLVGLFIDATEIDTYRTLKSSKTALEAYKLILGTIPRHKDNKSGNKKNDFALTSTMAAEFSSLIKNTLPEGVDFKTTPFEDVKAFEFEQTSANREDISSSALKNLINNSGSSQIMSIEKPVQSSIKAAQRVDEAFVKHLYYQAEDFVNYQIGKISPRYKFKIRFEGTIFDREDREKSAKEWASLGIITDKIAASLGYSPRDFDKAIEYMQSRGYPEKLKPLMSAFQTNANDTKGRPEKSPSEIGDAGEASKDSGVKKEA